MAKTYELAGVLPPGPHPFGASQELLKCCISLKIFYILVYAPRQPKNFMPCSRSAIPFVYKRLSFIQYFWSPCLQEVNLFLFLLIITTNTSLRPGSTAPCNPTPFDDPSLVLMVSCKFIQSGQVWWSWYNNSSWNLSGLNCAGLDIF